jgi:hypothetical protein
MFKNFTTDRVISFGQLIAVDWNSYNIEFQIGDMVDGLPDVTLACEGLLLWVHFGDDRNVSHITPILIVPRPRPYILNAFWNEFRATISTEHNGVPLHIITELENAD